MADLFLGEMPALSRSGDVLCEDIKGRRHRHMMRHEDVVAARSSDQLEEAFVSIDEQTGVRLQDGEKVLLALRETSWEGTVNKIGTLGLYVPWWNVKWYVVTDRRLITKKGIIGKKEVALPLRFVQDVSVICSPYNTGIVRISTAGGPESVLRIRSLKAADARQLADTVLSQTTKPPMDQAR